jgi:hypothetical protein
LGALTLTDLTVLAVALVGIFKILAGILAVGTSCFFFT